MIEGTLVNLRAQDMDDLERNYRWINDREVMRFLTSRYQYSLMAEEAWMRDRTSERPSYDNAAFAIVTKDGRHIGNTGLHHGSPEDRSCDLGIMIGEKDCWGRGYGTDALRTLVRFAFDDMNMNRVELDVYAFNERAIRSYEKVGFVREVCKRQDIYRYGEYIDVITMSVVRSEWEAKR